MHENLIPNDGYTEPGFIAAVSGLHGELRFKFRPMLVEDQSRVMRAMAKVQDATWPRKAADVICSRLLEWSLSEDRKPETVLRLKPALFSKLYGIVLGTDPTDIDPQWTPAEKTEAVADEWASILETRTPGEARAERHEKNFAAG